MRNQAIIHVTHAFWHCFSKVTFQFCHSKERKKHSNNNISIVQVHANVHVLHTLLHTSSLTGRSCGIARQAKLSRPLALPLSSQNET